MSISFNAYRNNNGTLELIELPDDSCLDLSSANGLDLLNALGIEESFSS